MTKPVFEMIAEEYKKELFNDPSMKDYEVFEQAYNIIAGEKYPGAEGTILNPPREIYEDHTTSYLYSLYHHYINGNNKYILNNDLAEDLFNSKVTINIEDFHPPFPAFSIHVPNSTLQRMDEVNGEVVLITIDIIHVRFEKINNTLTAYYLFSFIDEGNGESIDNWSNTKVGTFTCLDDFNKTSKVGHVGSKGDLPLTKKQKDLDIKLQLKIVNFILGFVLYVQTKPDDTQLAKISSNFNSVAKISNPKKRRRMEKQLEKETKKAPVYVGKEYSKTKQDWIKKDPKGAWKIQQETEVTGYWRYQWYGSRKDAFHNPQKGERKEVIWVNNFIKGKGLKLSTGTTRIVK